MLRRFSEPGYDHPKTSEFRGFTLGIVGRIAKTYYAGEVVPKPPKRQRAFDAVWRRIEACEGQVFRQIRGQEFTYTIKGTAVLPSTTKRLLHRSNFERTFRLVPLSNTVLLQNLQGPSYLFAIMMDPRIRKGYW